MSVLQKLKEKIRPTTWTCHNCGYVIPKKGAKLSGGPQYKYDYHVHCPKCDALVAQFVKPSEVR